jgi:DNA mismatch repair protein MutS
MNLTPAMKQYLEIKEKHRDCVLFFRMGDFYEMFFEDAVTASKVLDIALTSRNKNKEDSIPLCGIPYHAASSYIATLIDHGFKVAICEQIEDPKMAQGIVKREVVRIITPGLVVDPENLDAKANNYLAGVAVRDGVYGLAYADISTGEFRVTQMADRDFFVDEVIRHDFREILVEESLNGSRLIRDFSSDGGRLTINDLSSDYFDIEAARKILTEYFPQAPDRLEAEGHPVMMSAAGAVLRYIRETQKDHLNHINDIQYYRSENYLILDDNAKRNLELFSTIQGNTKSGSLFHVLDETVTAMGGRRLRRWLQYPLIDTGKIRERLLSVAEIKEQHLLRRDLRRLLSPMADLERLGGRITMGVCNARDLAALKNSIQEVPALKEVLNGLVAPMMVALREKLDEMPEVADLIQRSIVEDPPLTIREGGMIKEGYDPALDRLISIMREGKRTITALEEKEKKRTGIPSLKVGFNSIFGYYIEVTKTHAASVPEDYIRKQTLVNAERYINQELKEYEYTVLNAEDKRKDLEYELFIQVRDVVAKEIRRIQTTASAFADMDTLSSLAETAERYGYCCPTVDGEDVIDIKDGRHPVVERVSLSDGFVPNDTFLDCSGSRFLMITGPNMAGKSTYIRQVALIVIMAQMGGFVPAREARIGVVDRIFTRVGASDSLARGQSTFMVEMTEVANILKNATRKSLILLDEVGRGTSTFDGLSIAWAAAEYIHDASSIGARTLFATHYHQLTDMALTKDGVKNCHVAVKEWGDRIIFLRKIVEGGTNRSYGIQVARLAGVPDAVIRRAWEVLENLEKGELDEIGMPTIARRKKGEKAEKQGQLSLFADEEKLVVHELADTDLMNLTPMQILSRVMEWQERLRNKK